MRSQSNAILGAQLAADGRYLPRLRLHDACGYAAAVSPALRVFELPLPLTVGSAAPNRYNMRNLGAA